MKETIFGEYEFSICPHFVAGLSLRWDDKSAVVKEYKEEIEQLRKESDALAKKVGTLTIERDWLEGRLFSTLICDIFYLLNNTLITNTTKYNNN